MMKKRLLTRLQPSGELTLGSLIGGIRGTIEYQDEYESFIFVPDLHAITVPQDNGKKITTDIAKKKYEEVIKKIGIGRLWFI